MEDLEYLLDKFGFVRQTQVNNNFQKIESLIRFQLPEDYKYYLENYNPFDDSIGQEYVVLYSINDLLEISREGIINDSHTIAIGSNGASETIGIRFWEPKNYKIVIAQYIQDIDDHIEIGTSFTDMLQRLDAGKEWFE